MKIRCFQPGDEAAQVAIFNGAACLFPGFKPAKVEDAQKRTRARGFDPATRLYAVEGDEIVGYCVLEPGQQRVSFPWCKRGHTPAAAPLFEAVLDLARERGLKSVFAAYRHDWHSILDFFERQDFVKAREMVNYALDVLDLPTTAMGATCGVTRLRPEDLPAVAEMGKGILRLPAEKLEAYFFANPYFPAESVGVLRAGEGGSPVALGVGIERPTFADVRLIDPLAPCFRLGAFGTEGVNVKRVNGLFSFLVLKADQAFAHGLTLLAEACENMTDGTVNAVAAQAPSDVPHLVAFYSRYFKEQGRFPMYERTL